jgi:peptidoglycan hydrolase CwlO-like protein
MIKRYEYNGHEIHEYAEGSLILYDDHLAIVNEMKEKHKQVIKIFIDYLKTADDQKILIDYLKEEINRLNDKIDNLEERIDMLVETERLG